MKLALETICRHFHLDDEVQDISTFGSGHIHKTYKVECKRNNYILQQINQHVFKDIEGLSQNINKVYEYLKESNYAESHQLLSPVALVSALGTVYYDSKKNAWRMFHFVEGSRTFDTVFKPDLAAEGGRAFGAFIKALENFPLSNLVETIPGFHDVAFRLDSFLKAIENDVCYRVEFVPHEIEFLFDRAKEMEPLGEIIDKGLIPRRIAHNDTKVNNLLFDENDHAICVIDLDTLMPGYAIFDFGDAIRTFANTGSEDDKNKANIALSIEHYEAFARAYLHETKAMLAAEEIDNLAFAVKYITYEQILRFLLDYIEGDVYYKVNYPEHNLVRARAQIQLLKSIEAHFDEMQQIIHRYSY